MGRLSAAGLTVLAITALPAVADAYVGPGAGIAVATSALALVASIVLVVIGLLFWPIRWTYRKFTMKTPPAAAHIERAIIIGLDGLDPDIVRRFMDQGKLPNLEKLAEKGAFKPLHTTFPSMSPVAWSSFATGVNPAKHGIFDFLTRDRRTYLPDLSSAEILPPRKSIKVGKLQIPVGKPELKLLRKSKPFWEILGKYNIPSSVLRVPITFPPQSFHGYMLSAMCVPDLQGTQGSFTYFTTQEASQEESIGGRRIPLVIKDGGVVETAIVGPPNPMNAAGPALKAPLELVIDKEKQSAKVTLGKKTVTLEIGQNSEWLEVAFPMGLGMKMRGICQLRLLECGEQLRLYCTPINIDPSKPVLPISHPSIFATFLSKLIGRYTTLGLAEDTWALNEGVIDEEAFLEQAWSNHQERESMFFEMLRRTRKGILTCVFDGTDRIQHMFMRYMDDGHPALSEEDRDSEYKTVIEDTYCRMDEMLGRVMEEVDLNDPKTLLVVMSDHGFKTFRRGVNLNSWLHQNGYLTLKEGAGESREWFRDVDWEKTKAFALGLGGIFLNVEGREAKGFIAPGEEARALTREIADKLTGLVDADLDAVCIREAYVSEDLYKGPYTDDAPDLIVGYEAGWRASWDGVRGVVNETVFDDNTKAWSGDHCIDPKLVPGVLIANRDMGGPEPSIADMAPTLLELFGVPAPRYMDGSSLV